MTSGEVREKYIDFFRKAPRSHKEISPAPLVPEGDPSTLFTSSGMQQLIPNLMGEKHPEGERLVNSQPCLRLEDIGEVGNNRHTTYFEMLGNWSLGDYFKKEQLPWIWEFFTAELGLPKERLYVTVHNGSSTVPKDTESYEIWKKIGLPSEKIFYYDDNWWSRSGTPDKMPPGEIGGPDSEVFFEFTSVPHDPKFGKECHPNCECGRFFEIGNSVFIEYKKLENGKLEPLPQKNVDFGGGLERTVAATEDQPDIFLTDAFIDVIKKIEEVSKKPYQGNRAFMQVIADHMRGSAALISEGVIPSNKVQGYILRRLIRRSAIKMKFLKGDLRPDDLNLGFDKNVSGVIEEEAERFSKSLERGLRQVEKIQKVDAKKAFDLYQTFGFPVELTRELFLGKGQDIDEKGFEEEFKKHKELSRTASSGMFKGGLADKSEETKKLHTVTHLLHASLRKVLGEHVEQKGSNITAERLRFDFSYREKLSDEELKKVEDMINEQIKKDLKVTSETMTLEEARKKGALAFFGQKYDEKVKVYKVGDFSCEVCGGPHVEKLSEIGGRVKIIRQESAGANVRRIYAAVV